MSITRTTLLVGLALAVALTAMCYQRREQAEQARAVAIAVAVRPVPPPPPAEQVTKLEVQPGVSFGVLLQRAGIDGDTTQQLIAAAQPVMNFRQLRPGQGLELVRTSNGTVKQLRYRPDVGDEIRVTRGRDGFTAERRSLDSATEVVAVSGKVNSSLFESVIAAGEHPELAVRLAEIFAWDLDFYTDPRAGDTFRLVFERKSYDRGTTVAYGRIFAAEYVNDGRSYKAVLFHDPQGRPAYYADDGKSLQKTFLRSPLKFAARISSHFSTHRFHPVLKMYRAHLGTDYAAPVGTPVQAVANGRVEFAASKGGDGRMVQLRHSNGYETYYLHLSRIMVRPGQAVRQGQLIGLVGASGLATGPHLDFRVRRAGRFVNFEGMKLPPAEPVAKADLAEFATVRDKWIGQLSANMPVMARAESTGVSAGTQ